MQVKNSEIGKKNFGQRIDIVLKELGLSTHAEFLNLSGLNKVTFYSIIRHNRKPQRKTLALLKEKVGINPNWLLTGEGEMFLAGTKEQAPEEQKANMPEVPGEVIAVDNNVPPALPRHVFFQGFYRYIADCSKNDLDLMLKVLHLRRETLEREQG